MKLHTKERKLTEEEQKEKDRLHKKIIFLTCVKPFLRWYRILFRKEKNPLYAWRTYQHCRQCNVPPPEWIFDYLDEVAKNLLNSSDRTSKKMRTGAFSQKALKMDKRGQGDVFRRFFENERKINIAGEISLLSRDKQISLEDARTQVSNETGIPCDTLRDWHYRFRD